MLTPQGEKPFESVVGGKKEKMLVSTDLSFFHNVFYPIKENMQYLNYIENAIFKCFQFG